MKECPWVRNLPEQVLVQMFSAPGQGLVAILLSLGMGGVLPGMAGVLPGMAGVLPGMGGVLPGMGGALPGMDGILPGMAGVLRDSAPCGHETHCRPAMHE